MTVEHDGGGTFRITCGASDLVIPVYYWWLDGSFLCESRNPQTIVSVDPGTYPTVEVFDDPDRRPEFKLPPVRSFEFARSEGASRYLVERSDGAGGWDYERTIAERGAPMLRASTGPLPDSETTTFRVTPTGENEVDGTASTKSILMIRYPDPPDVTFAYAAGTHKVTVAAGA